MQFETLAQLIDDLSIVVNVAFDELDLNRSVVRHCFNDVRDVVENSVGILCPFISVVAGVLFCVFQCRAHRWKRRRWGKIDECAIVRLKTSRRVGSHLDVRTRKQTMSWIVVICDEQGEDLCAMPKLYETEEKAKEELQKCKLKGRVVNSVTTRFVVKQFSRVMGTGTLPVVVTPTIGAARLKMTKLYDEHTTLGAVRYYMILNEETEKIIEWSCPGSVRMYLEQEIAYGKRTVAELERILKKQ